MPLYEYTCRKCSHRFERLESSKISQVASCPSCHSEEVDRLLGLPGAGKVVTPTPATNCRGDGPPCGAPYCGRNSFAN
jgi:putative FmdB family regulatory protein